MNVLYWNCRGMGNAGTQHALFNFCQTYNLDVFCIAEPKVFFSSIPFSYWRAMGYCYVTNNGLDLPSLWVLVYSSIGAGNVSILASSEQHITLSFHKGNMLNYVSCVYANILSSSRRRLWSNLQRDSSFYSGN